MKSTPNFKKYSNSSTYNIEAKELDYLYIKESQIPGSGKGLFTAIPIYKDEVISIFKGKILSDIEAQCRAANGEDGCFINLPDGTILDSMEVKCFAKYANDVLGVVETRYRNNSIITLDEDGNVCIVANRKILAAEEIFCGYGYKYWEKYRKQFGIPANRPLVAKSYSEPRRKAAEERGFPGVLPARGRTTRKAESEVKNVSFPVAEKKVSVSASKVNLAIPFDIEAIVSPVKT